MSSWIANTTVETNVNINGTRHHAVHLVEEGPSQGSSFTASHKEFYASAQMVCHARGL